MPDFNNQLIEELIEREGGYVNDPQDRGGETNYGITKKVANKNGYVGDMKKLPYEFAFNLYKKSYWHTLRLDEISKISEKLAVQLFDFGINSGIANAGHCLQVVLNVLNQKQDIYHDLVTDGIVGSKTIVAINKFIEHRQEQGLHVLIEAIRAQRISFCIDIAVNDESQEKYQFGWLHRIVNL